MASDASPFAKLMPGFEFLQGLVKNAGAATPGIGQWVAPTLNPEEIQKRIDELKTVQFWLEQNARMIGATVQALEVQRMTLSTLKTMNVQMSDLRDSMRLPERGSAAAASPGSSATAATDAARPRGARKPSPAETSAPAGVVDPMQWWGALTKQFTQLATSAMKDSAGEAAKSLAGSMVKQSFDAAEQTLKKAVSAPIKAAGAVAKAAKAAKSASQSSATRRRSAAPR